MIVFDFVRYPIVVGGTAQSSIRREASRSKNAVTRKQGHNAALSSHSALFPTLTFFSSNLADFLSPPFSTL